MRASRKFLLLLLGVIVVATGVRVAWQDWNNRRFDAAAQRLSEAAKPHMDTLTNLLLARAGGPEFSPQEEQQLKEAAEALYALRQQAEALPSSPGRQNAKQAWIMLLDGIRRRVMEFLEEKHKPSPLPSSPGDLGMETLIHDVQSWLSTYELLSQFAKTGVMPGE